MKKHIFVISAFAILIFSLMVSVGFAETTEIKNANDALDYASDLVDNYDSGEVNYLQFIAKFYDLKKRAWAIRNTANKDLGPMTMGQGYRVVSTGRWTPGSTQASDNPCKDTVFDPKIAANCAQHEIKGTKVTVIGTFCKGAMESEFDFEYIINYPFCNVTGKNPVMLLDDFDAEITKYEEKKITLKQLYYNLDALAQDLVFELRKSPIDVRKNYLKGHFTLGVDPQTGKSAGHFTRDLDDVLPIYLYLSCGGYIQPHDCIDPPDGLGVVFDSFGTYKPWNIKNVTNYNLLNDSEVSKKEICAQDINHVCFEDIEMCREKGYKYYSALDKDTFKTYCNFDLLDRYDRELPAFAEGGYFVWLSEVENKSEEKLKDDYKAAISWRRTELEKSYPLDWVCEESDPLAALKDVYGWGTDVNYYMAQENMPIATLLKGAVKEKDCEISYEEKKGTLTTGYIEEAGEWKPIQVSGTFMYIKYDIKPSREQFVDSMVLNVKSIKEGSNFGTNQLDGTWAIKITDDGKELAIASFTIEGGNTTTVSAVYDETAENTIVSDVDVLYDIHVENVREGELPPKKKSEIDVLMNSIGMFLKDVLSGEVSMSMPAYGKITTFLEMLR